MNDTPDEPKRTPGQIVKTAREARRITLNEVAQRLLLSKKIIVAIEEDDYSTIPAKVYAEGYLKAYAQFLDIPSGEVIEVFRSLNFYPADIVIKENPTKRGKTLKDLFKIKGSKQIWSSILGFLFLIIVIFLLKTFFYKNVTVEEITDSKDERAPVTSTVINGEEANLEGDDDSRTITLDLSQDANGYGKKR